jgi:hypothetical protein
VGKAGSPYLSAGRRAVHFNHLDVFNSEDSLHMLECHRSGRLKQ